VKVPQGLVEENRTSGQMSLEQAKQRYDIGNDENALNRF